MASDGGFRIEAVFLSGFGITCKIMDDIVQVPFGGYTRDKGRGGGPPMKKKKRTLKKVTVEIKIKIKPDEEAPRISHVVKVKDSAGNTRILGIELSKKQKLALLTAIDYPKTRSVKIAEAMLEKVRVQA